MYCFESRVRFSETDKERKLTLEAIVDYFQDCSTFQTEDLGVGFSYLLPKNLTWILSYWHIVVEESPDLGENVLIGTLPYEFRGFFGKRNFFMEKEGRRIVKADSLWTLLDTEKIISSDGNTFIIEITSKSKFEITQRIMSLASKCKVLYPQSFQTYIIYTLRKMKEGYIETI